MRATAWFYVGILALALLVLVVGNRIARWETGEWHGPTIVTARVVEIISRVEEVHVIRQGVEIVHIDVHFRAYVTSGERRGYSDMHHSWVTHVGESTPVVRQGDRVLLIYAEGREMFFFFDFLRIHFVGILAVVFFLLILFFGRAKGFTSLIALGFTCASIFFMFIPAILSGWNIYLATAVLCAYAVLFTLLLVVGPNAKAISATLGCFGGVLFAALLMLLTSEVLRISGLVDSTSQQLFVLPTPRPLDLRAIVFAGVIIGAVGAIMDVAMSIASALWEIGDSGGAKDFAGFFKAGINIGRDIMGTMLNTLILAYIGSSMTMILLLTGSTLPMLQLLNSEQIVVELIRALVGSFGMLLAIPLTAAICAWVYPRFMRVADTTDTH